MPSPQEHTHCRIVPSCGTKRNEGSAEARGTRYTPTGSLGIGSGVSLSAALAQIPRPQLTLAPSMHRIPDHKSCGEGG